MIRIYSTESCPWCVKTKQYLKSRNIKFQELDIQNNINARREMVEKTNQIGVPVIDIDGTIIVGFDKGAIDNALKEIFYL